MLLVAEQLMKTGNMESRRAFLALYYIFNSCFSADQRMENLQHIENRYSTEVETPCVENMLVNMMQQQSPNWKLSDYQHSIEKYFEQRNWKNGLKLPRTFEAAILLFYAEQHRLAGNFKQVQELVSKATECHPGHKPIHELECDFRPEAPIHWCEVVFPNYTNPEAGKGQ